MHTSLLQKYIQKLRAVVPLGVRRGVGPLIAYAVYFINVHFRKNRKRPRVLSLEATVDLIKDHRMSVIRFGDGEMSLILGDQDLAFQKKDGALAKRLAEILKAGSESLLICIPGIWESLSGFTSRSFWFSLHHLFRYGYVWKGLLSLEQTYGDAFITRPYLTYKDKAASEKIFTKMIALWENLDVVLIEGAKSRLGVGNDLFAKVKSLGRILCPAENAYSKYGAILEAARKTDKNKLILISLGPAGKVLAYDLFLAGYRVLDIGHIDMEYEMFIRKAPGLIKVKYKYFNEIDERAPEECKDEEYIRQIIAII